MTNKEYLKLYRAASRDFDAAVYELSEIRARYEGIRAIIYSDMPKSHDTERDLSDAMVAIEKATEKCSRICTRALQTMEDVQRAIDRVEDIDQRRVLRCRYMYGMKWEVISETMGFTRQWVNVLHGRALQNLGR